MIEKFEPKEIFLTENAILKILSLREEEANKSLMLRVFVTVVAVQASNMDSNSMIKKTMKPHLLILMAQTLLLTL